MRIADLITANPKLATELVIYMRSAQGLSRAQMVAAEQGLAAAADRLGIQAKDGDEDVWGVALAVLAVAAMVAAAVALSRGGGGGSPAFAVPASGH